MDMERPIKELLAVRLILFSSLIFWLTLVVPAFAETAPLAPFVNKLNSLQSKWTSDEVVCERARHPNALVFAKANDPIFQWKSADDAWVGEATKRGLDCGLSESPTVSKQSDLYVCLQAANLEFNMNLDGLIPFTGVKQTDADLIVCK